MDGGWRSKVAKERESIASGVEDFEAHALQDEGRYNLPPADESGISLLMDAMLLLGGRRYVSRSRTQVPKPKRAAGDPSHIAEPSRQRW